MATNVKERPILFSGLMVRAIMEGRKSQTRRVIKPQPERDPFACHYVRSGWALSDPWEHGVACTCKEIRFPYASRKPDGPDRLWVRETHLIVGGPKAQSPRVIYRASNEGPDAWVSPVWRPSIFMPRWASRLTLEITDIRIERLQEISEGDAEAEGYWQDFKTWEKSTTRLPSGNISSGFGDILEDPRDWYQKGWDALNAKRGYSWESNPFVWVIEFKKLEQPSSQPMIAK